MSATEAPVYTRRYQAWLDAGRPDELYTLWVQAKWRKFFELVKGFKPGANATVSLGVAINTAHEDMGFFVVDHQDAFDDWLETGAVPA
jgi:hypothetical protein